jgi:uncharacterized membrane protein YhaH (DUF805 family)
MNDGPFGGVTWGDFFRVAFWLSALVWAGGLMLLFIGVLLSAAVRSEGMLGFVTLIAMFSVPGGALGAILSAIGVQVTRLIDAAQQHEADHHHVIASGVQPTPINPVQRPPAPGKGPLRG